MIIPDYIDAYPRNLNSMVLGYTPLRRSVAKLHRMEMKRAKREELRYATVGAHVRKKRRYTKSGHNRDKYHK